MKKRFAPMNNFIRKTTVILFLLYYKPLYGQSEYYLKTISSILCNDTINLYSAKEVYIHAINSTIKNKLSDSLELNCKSICILKSNKLIDKYFKSGNEKMYFISADSLDVSDSIKKYSVMVSFIDKKDSKSRRKNPHMHIYAEFIVSLENNKVLKIQQIR